MTPTRTRSPEPLSRFEQLTAWPMLFLALATLPLLLAPILMDLSPATETVVFGLDWLLWGLFAVEYLIRLFLAPRRGEFVRKNLIDLAVVALPLLRPIRVLRSARMLTALRAGRSLLLVARGLKTLREILTRHKLNYLLLVALVVASAAALLVYGVEHGQADANIITLADAFWWAITTVTTVGYGDRFPVTAPGRGIAVVLMILGISLFGVLSASIAAYFIEEREEKELDPQLEAIAARLERIEAALGGLETPVPKREAVARDKSPPGEGWE
jgi:voltage-gated potassium channel